MALRNYKPRTDVIHTGIEETTVRGLNVADVSILAHAYWPRMKATYDFYVAIGDGVSIDEKVNQTILECTLVAPDMVGAIIALACGEPDEVEAAKSLPFTTQIDALVKIMTLTLEEIGGLGNFLAVLSQAVAVLKGTSRGAAPPKTETPRMVPDPLATH